MPLTWEQFANTDAYKSLNRQDRVSAKLGFFKQVMQDSPSWANLNEDQRLQVTQHFFADEMQSTQGIGKTIFESIKAVPRETLSSILTAAQGQSGADVINPDWSDRFITETERQARERVRLSGNRPLAFGLTTKDIAELPQNLGFSLGGMGAGLAAGIPASAVGTPIAGWGAGMAAGGTFAYRAASGQIMRSYLEAANDEKIKTTGKPLTAEEQNTLKKDFDSKATQYGLWEAIPEAIGTAGGLKILTAPLMKIGGRKLAQTILGRLAGVYGEELLTETITQQGQHNIVSGTPISEGPERKWDVTGLAQSAKEVAPQVGLLTTVMAPIGLAAGANARSQIPARESRLNMLKAPRIETVERIEPDTGLTPPNIETVRQDQFEFPAQTPEEQAQMQRDIEIQRAPEHRARTRMQAAIINEEQAQQAQEQAQERESRRRRGARAAEQQRLEQTQREIEATNIEAENEAARNRFNALEDLYDLAHDAGRRGAGMPQPTSPFIGRLTRKERSQLRDYYRSGQHIARVLRRNQIDEEQEDAEGIFGEQEPSGEEISERRHEPGGGAQEGETQRGDQLLVQASQERERGALERGVPLPEAQAPPKAPSGPSPAVPTQKVKNVKQEIDRRINEDEPFRKGNSVEKPTISDERIRKSEILHRESSEKQPWEMSYEELKKSVTPNTKDELVKSRNILAVVFPEQLDSVQDPWGIRRSVERGDEIPRTPITDLSVRHKKIIKQALSEGKPVPETVLKDYPDLRPQQQTPKAPPTLDKGAEYEQKLAEYTQERRTAVDEGRATESDIRKAETEVRRTVAPESAAPTRLSTKPKGRQAIGRAWTGNQWRPIISQTEIKRGKNKGKMRVVLPNGRKLVVTAESIKPIEVAPAVEKQAAETAQEEPARGAKKPILKNQAGSSQLYNDVVNLFAKPQTETRAFKKWFGDSKVVDANGNPLVVYHGTDKVFDVFNTKAGLKTEEMHASAGLGSFFSNDPGIAGVYTGRAKSSGGEGGNIIPVYLSIKNPYYMEAKEMMGLDTFPKVKQKILKLKRSGFDGIIQKGVEGLPDTEMRQIVAFEPTQIKSAIGNTGAFDPNNPSIIGSSQMITDIAEYGASLIENLKEKGIRSFRNFRAAMHQKFLDIWDKIKGHMRALWRILSNERGQVDVYHGSPHRFEKFSAEKIGTGEGAQAFGWGLYFTDQKEIADHYANTLSPTKDVHIDGERVKNRLSEQEIREVINRVGTSKALVKDQLEKKLRPLMPSENGLSNGYIVVFDRMQPDGAQWSVIPSDQSHGKPAFGRQASEKDAIKYAMAELTPRINAISKAIEDVGKSKKIELVSNATTYKATLHEGKDPSDYSWLDWHEKAPKDIKEKIKAQAKIEGYERGTYTPDFHDSGKDIYQDIADDFKSEKEASLFLQRAGIDGIRYPAGTLSGGGTGTNYVVFDENAVTIKEINGQLLDALKNEKGSSELVNDILNAGIEFKFKFQDSFHQWRAAMHDRFREIWSKISRFMRRLWDSMPTVMEQRGSITIEGKKETPQAKPEIPKEKAPEPPKQAKQQIESDQLSAIETAKAFLQKPRMTQQTKKDLSYIGDLLAGLPSFFAEKIPAVKKIFDASQARQDEFHEGISWMETHDNAKVTDQWKRLKGPERNKASKYLIQNDRDMTGFRVAQRKSGNWVALDREGKKIAEFESQLTEDMIDKGDVAAVERIIQEETKYLNEQGFSPDQIAAIISFRLSTNKGFDVLFASMRKLIRTYREHNMALPTIPVTENGKAVHIDLEQAMARMNDIRGFYYPRIRKPGRHILRAFKKGEYNILETFGFARRMNVRRTELEKQGYTVDTGPNTQLGEDVFEMAGKLVATQQIVNAALDNIDKSYKNASKEDIDDLDKKMDALFVSALAEQIANVIRERGSRVHMTRRSPQVYIGYEEDPEIAIAKYIRGIAAGEAKRNMVMKMMRAFTGTDVSWKDFKAENPDAEYDDYRDMVKENMIDQREQKNAFKWAKAYIAENTRNQEPADRAIGIVKGVAVAKYLAFRVFSAPLVNMTALPTSAVASMKAAGIPYGSTFRLLASAAKKYGSYRLGRPLSADQQRVFDHIRQKGWDNPQFNSEALTTLRGAIGRRYDKVIEYGMWTFSESERLNRAATIAGAYNGLARMNTGEDFETLMNKAKKISDDSHGIYNRGNYPYVALGRHPAALVTKAFYVFRTFSHTYLNNLYQVGFKQGDKLALAHMLIAPAVIAGAGASVLTPLISIILKAMGMDEPEEQAYLKIGELFGPSTENVARFGVTAIIPGGGMSMKGSLSIGITDIPTELHVKDFLGAPGSVIDEIFHLAPASILRGDVAKGVEKLLPTGFGNLIRAYREGTEGITTRNNAPVFYGDEQMKLNLVESIYRGMSFNPARIAGMREKQYRERMIEDKYRQRKTDLYAKIKRYILEGSRDTSKWAELIGEIERYNEDAARWKLSPITRRSIKTNLKRSFKPSRRERMRQ